MTIFDENSSSFSTLVETKHCIFKCCSILWCFIKFHMNNGSTSLYVKQENKIKMFHSLKTNDRWSEWEFNMFF